MKAGKAKKLRNFGKKLRNFGKKFPKFLIVDISVTESNIEKILK